MPEIHKLSTDMANLIAAGEVVERPASVVKELVENAIDAGATAVTVEITNGGIAQIRVTDNGCGIAKEEARTAFLRHATSKIATEADLFEIKTLGFRGEALAAIAAVSKIDIFTKQTRSSLGVHLSLDAGEEREFEEVGCPNGTTIVVSDLFYNTPARMKFLKNDRTEASHISGILEHLAISRPNIAVKLIRDRKIIFATLGDGLLDKAIYSVYGKEFAVGLLAISGVESGIEMTGCISPSFITRANKNMQNFFINGRYVQSRLLYAAVERAYQGRLMTGRAPVCFLNIRTSYRNVDVNVHPNKLDVKFANEKMIFDVIYHRLTDALNTAENLGEADFVSHTPSMPVSVEDINTYPAEVFSDGIVRTESQPMGEFRTKLLQSVKSKLDEGKGIVFPEVQPPIQVAQTGTSYCTTQLNNKPSTPTSYLTNQPSHIQTQSQPVYYNRAIPSPSRVEPLTTYHQETMPMVGQNKNSTPSYKIIGEAFKTYIVIEQDNVIKLIDKHAVHEKMVYQKIKAQDLHHFAQALLSPVQISLTREEKAIVQENREVFTDLGFELEDRGTNIVVLRQGPSYVALEDMDSIVTQIIEQIATHKFARDDLYEELIKSVACKAAVKAGFVNVTQELAVLVDAVLTTPGLGSCPHGRPTVCTLPRSQVEKMFKRI